VGLGYILRKQSEKKWIVRCVMEWIKRPEGKKWWDWAGKELSKSMTGDYNFEVSEDDGIRLTGLGCRLRDIMYDIRHVEMLSIRPRACFGHSPSFNISLSL
jgi:hypothetical protein